MLYYFCPTQQTQPESTSPQPAQEPTTETAMPEVTTAPAPPQQLPVQPQGVQTPPKIEKQSKSFEERSQEYQRARERIFNQDVSTECQHSHQTEQQKEYRVRQLWLYNVNQRPN